MPQTTTLFQEPASRHCIDTALDAGAWRWAGLDNNQLETWLGDYMWFADFADPEHRANCARTCDELIVECALRNRQDMIRRAWARLARSMRGLQ
jgi:hypothetical protein